MFYNIYLSIFSNFLIIKNRPKTWTALSTLLMILSVSIFGPVSACQATTCDILLPRLLSSPSGSSRPIKAGRLRLLGDWDGDEVSKVVAMEASFCPASAQLRTTQLHQLILSTLSICSPVWGGKSASYHPLNKRQKTRNKRQGIKD